MAESQRTFACPKCGQIIDFGTNPCSYCGMPIAWEGLAAPADEPPVNSLPEQIVEPASTISTPVVETPYIAEAFVAAPAPTSAPAPVYTSEHFATPAPTPTLTPLSQPAFESLPENFASPAPVPTSDLTPAFMSTPEPQSAPVAAPEPIPAPVSEPAPVPQPVAAPEPIPAPLPEPAPAPVPQPAPVSALEPAPAPQPVAVPEPAPAPVPEPAPVPQPVAVPEPAPAPQPVAAPEPAPVPQPAPVSAPAPQPAPVAAPAPQLAPVAAPAALSQGVVVPPSPVRNTGKVKGSATVRAFAGFLKFLAVLVWIAAAIVLLTAVSGDLGIDLPRDFINFVGAFAGTNALLTSITWAVIGFVLFGIGVLIHLLNIVRRNTRL